MLHTHTHMSNPCELLPLKCQ